MPRGTWPLRLGCPTQWRRNRMHMNVSLFVRRCSMSTLEEVRRQNRELADRIKEETSKDPHSPYAGKCVGIVNGQVVAVDG